ncbi:retrotransposon ORF1 [Tanacetum coccineum]
MKVEEASPKAMLAVDRAGFDWSFMAEEEVPTNMALMAFSDSEVQKDKTCSSICLKSFETLKAQYDKLRIYCNKTKFDLANYKRALASVEEQLSFYKQNEVIFTDKIAVLKRDATFNEAEIITLKTIIEKLKKEKEDNLLKIKNYDNATKSLDKVEIRFISEISSIETKKTPDAPIIEDWVSDCEEDEIVSKVNKENSIKGIVSKDFISPTLILNIAPNVLSTEEPDNSLSMGDEHLSTISATESDEVIKSSVENLVPIPSELEGILDIKRHAKGRKSGARLSRGHFIRSLAWFGDYKSEEESQEAREKEKVKNSWPLKVIQVYRPGLEPLDDRSPFWKEIKVSAGNLKLNAVSLSFRLEDDAIEPFISLSKTLRLLYRSSKLRLSTPGLVLIIKETCDQAEDEQVKIRFSNFRIALEKSQPDVIKSQNGHILLVQIYVDDIIFGSTKKELCDEFEKLMKDKFQMSSMGELTFFLGLQVQQRKKGIFIRKPFIEISNMTHDQQEGVVRFINGNDEVTYKMPHKIEQYNSLSNLEKEHTKSVYLRNEEDKRREVEYVMSKILGFYKECLELGPEYLTGVEDEGEVTLYLMRRSLEALRKFYWMILRGRFNQLSHVSSPLLSKPGEY